MMSDDPPNTGAEEPDDAATPPVPRTLKAQFQHFAQAVVPVVSIDQQGDEGIGAAFHVGEGVFVTARHVVEGMQSVTVRGQPITPGYHADPDIDVGVFRLRALADLPAMDLGGHLDDWINDDAFMLNDVLVMGYPPIPLARQPVLIATRGEVTGVVDLLMAKHVHFLLSVMARGGFSGGAVISEWDFVLGVITKSLVRNNVPEELGYLTVLSVEPIYECLAQNDLLTKSHREFFGDLFDSLSPTPGHSGGSSVT